MVPAAVCDILRSTVDHHCRTQTMRGKTSWRTLYTYTKMDLPCCEVPNVTDIAQTLITNVNGLLSFIFNTPVALNPRSWKEPHFLRYEHASNTTSTNPITSPHVGVESHYDGSHFTWSLMLSRPEDYSGGGTFVRQLRTTLRLDQGQVLLHPGDLYHTGIDITSGVREYVRCPV
jgi:predicted 2-oxoglutarate/Fe(II)-dependent dioxygenase YbiX